MTQVPDYQRGRKDGIQWTITWLHARAKIMNDPKAQAVLNSAAFHLGQDLHKVNVPNMSEQFRRYHELNQEIPNET